MSESNFNIYASLTQPSFGDLLTKEEGVPASIQYGSNKILSDKSRYAEEDGNVSKNCKIAILSVLVLVFGVCNAVSGKIMTVPMGDFTFFLGIFNSILYILVFFSILGIKVVMKYVPKSIFGWVWLRSGEGNFFQRLPALKFFLAIGFLDGFGQFLDLVSRPHVAGPLLQLLPQGALIFNIIVSALFLRDRFTFWQLWSVFLLLFGVVLTLTPVIGDDFGGEPMFIGLVMLYPIPLSISYAIKDYLFRVKKDLDIFVVNSHSSLFQFLFQPIFLPLAFLLNPKQLDNQPVSTYISSAFECIAGITPIWVANEGRSCSINPYPYLIYITFNTFLNIVMLTFVKEASMVVTFLVFSALLPLSVMSFYVDWPLLNASQFSPWHVGGLLAMVAALGLYRTCTYIKTKYHLNCCSVYLPTPCDTKYTPMYSVSDTSQ